ncbi:patatin-like phospholipase family protein [Bradyrhizobium sp. BRP23]|uniref:patatin-like phospholipase family protein n=1 Tax=Bradyrhizobium sp. BRP23 TaxID=2793820 RepID=UPI001CD2F434|nr:patatin-like phospholipase family protein [Bradyrhizobium sp. BRP23]MCA1382715.1 patatin-like phospholipase family protein [Bradyrhizobium sp. BRP05]MCA1421821.1 patatin-like phospholipase family protein [Bradyrhizobium sp. BRP23]
MNDVLAEPASLFRVLCLDGGGAKGFYTLGALKEIEGMLGCRIYERFDLIYGTSTGAIIAALLGLGRSVDEVEALYRKHVVSIMARWLPSKKTAALEALATDVFGELKFDAFKTEMGIVGTRWVEERPIIFKTGGKQAFLGKATFEPGFGCTIGEAVVGSCSAYPFFRKKMVVTGRGERIEVRDGGFVANNPTLYAIVDATESLGHSRQNVRVVSIGVGEYPRLRKFSSVQFDLRLVSQRRCLLQRRQAHRKFSETALGQSYCQASGN